MSNNWKIYGANVKVDLTTCYYCKEHVDEFSATVDHLIPESRGGIRANKNKVPSCGDCNKLKGDMTPEEFQRALSAMIRLKGKEHRRNVAYLKKVSASVQMLIESKDESNK